MTVSFYMPTRIYSGANICKEITTYVPEHVRTIVLVTGCASARRYGYTDALQTYLTRDGRDVHVFDSVEENPSYATVDRITALARAKKAEGVVGLGGGSVLDASKAAALCAVSGMSAAAAVSAPPAHGALFYCAIPTTAGTGSEVTQYAILTDSATQRKENLATALMFPSVALLDETLTASMPVELTRDTGIDALSHAVEGYISLRATPFSDAYARAAITRIATWLPRVLASPEDNTARREMLEASCMAGMVIAQTGTTACHALGYYLTLRKGLRHGHANAVLLSRVVAWVQKYVPEKVADIEGMLGSTVEAFVSRCGVTPDASLSAVDAVEIQEMAQEAATRGNTAATPGLPSAEDLVKIVCADVR